MPPSRPRQVSADNMVYERIRDDLFAGRYEPGAKLRIEEMVSTYSYGASPIREALSRLAEAGLIIYEAQRGYRVAPVSAEEYEDLVSMRLMLEPEALRHSITNGTLDWESNVVAAFHRLSMMHTKLSEGSMEAFRNWAREDRGFHMALIGACQSKWLLNFSRAIIEQTARYHRDQVLSGVLPIQKTQEEHRRLMEVAVGRKAEDGYRLLREHITNASTRIREAVRKAGSIPVTVKARSGVSAKGIGQNADSRISKRE